MDIREILIAMRELLTPDGAWTQNACWRDKDGSAMVEKTAAVSHCLYGAAQSVGRGLLVSDILCDFLNARVPDPSGFISWNDRDHRTQAEVLAFLDECIAEFDSKEPIAPIMVRELEDA